MRLYVAWPGYEPTRGNFNETYIAGLKSIVDALGEAGIYTILDCHQDVFSPKFCGEGAPDFAAIYRNGSSEALKFPLPMAKPYAVGPDGYPTREECLQHPFFW